jgi:hypothetical protein
MAGGVLRSEVAAHPASRLARRLPHNNGRIMNRLLNNGADSIAANPGKSDQESDFAVYRIDGNPALSRLPSEKN